MGPSNQLAIEEQHMDDMNSRTQLARGRRARPWSSSRVALVVAVTSALTLTVGLLVGRFAISRGDDRQDGVFLAGVPERLMEAEDPDVAQKIIDGIDHARIEENLM